MEMCKKLKSKPKYRIIKRDNKFVAQEFIGRWIIGIYMDLTYTTDHDLGIFIFEHDTLNAAEAIINKQVLRKNKKFIIKEYYV